MPEQTGVNVLGRTLTPDEATLAFSKTIDALPLARSLVESLSKKGFRTIVDLAAAPQTAVNMSEVRLRRVRRALLAALLGENHLARLANASLADLPDSLRNLLAHVEDRRRVLLERESGLWDGHKHEPTRAARDLGVSYATAQRERANGHADVRQLLGADSDQFRAAMRALYLRILAGKQGMAGVHEWEDQGSALYENQIEACLGFAFLCRVSAVKPELLVTVGLDGACYDGTGTKRRHDQAVDAMKIALLNAGRPVPFEEMRRRLAAKNRIEVSPEFLKRCVEVSRELGFEHSGMIGLRSWPYFDAHNLHDMACAALAAIGETAGYERIAQVIERLYPWRAPVNRASLHQILMVHKDKFVLMRHGGIFGLPEWHVRAAGSLKNFVVDFLRENGGRGKRREIVAAAQAKHGFKASSVQTTLSQNKELFRRAGGGEWELAVQEGARNPGITGDPHPR